MGSEGGRGRRVQDSGAFEVRIQADAWRRRRRRRRRVWRRRRKVD